MTTELLKVIVDEVFAVAEQSLGTHPLAVNVLKGVNVLIDTTLLSIIAQNLSAKGVTAQAV